MSLRRGLLLFVSCSFAACLTAEPPAPPQAATAPGLALAQSQTFRGFVDDALDNFYMRRIEQLQSALETGERSDGFGAAMYNSLFERHFSPAEAHFNAGEEIFDFDFEVGDGLGDGMGGKPPNMHRVHRGQHGGPDTTGCHTCHHRGGDDGAGEYPEAAFLGGDGQNTYHANERNPPPLLGGGALQILAGEINRALREQVAYHGPSDSDVNLYYQGVNFGTVTLHSDGSIDTSKLIAIDRDMVVRPFGWKGTHSSLRRFAEEAFQVHHGMQSEVLVRHRMEFGALPQHASPTTVALFESLGDGPPQDPDRDGVLSELRDQFLTVISVYLALLPLPAMDPPQAPDLFAAWQRGEAVFHSVGCASCHKPSWGIHEPVWQEVYELDHAKPPIQLDLRRDIQRGPKMTLYDNSQTDYRIYPYSDLRRHDMGPELADRYESGGPHQGDRRSAANVALVTDIPPSYFLTRPLWGLADSAPYLHDGRATTIPQAILAHGGEAQKVRDAYRALPQQDQRALHVFLLSLTRPPVPEVAP